MFQAKIDDLNKKLDEMMQQLSNKDSEKEGLISELETLKNQIEEQKVKIFLIVFRRKHISKVALTNNLATK